MASLLCVCDEIVDLSPIPNPNEGLVISDSDYCEWNDLGSKPKEIISKMRVMIECPHCCRIGFYLNGFSQLPEMYEPTPYE